MKLIIPGEFPTMNEIINASKAHKMKYARMKKEYGAVVFYHSKHLGKITGRNAYHCKWYRTNRRHDPDNIAAGGTKVLLDGLMASKVLENDGHKQVGRITHDFGVDKENPRVEVEIIPMEE